MKKRMFIVGATLTGVVGALLVCARLPDPLPGNPGSLSWRRADFMDKKRLYSQLAFEGFMMGRKADINAYGRALWDASEKDVWEELFTDRAKDPVFRQRAKEFRDGIKAMLDALDRKNPDAAMTAYTKSLQSCYDCHKHVRPEANARLRE